MVMLMTVLTLPSRAGEGNQAVCGSLGQLTQRQRGRRNATPVR